MTNLSQLAPGERAKIIKLGDVAEVRFKLLSLGLLPGDVLTVVSCAPFGGPQVISHGDQLHFAIRKEASKLIEVEKWVQ